jgi:hypothetical protein
MNLKFECPKCGCDFLEEIMSDVIVNSAIMNLDSEGDFDYGEQIRDGGVVERYQCEGCGWEVVDDFDCTIDDSLELVEWLKKRPENSGE